MRKSIIWLDYNRLHSPLIPNTSHIVGIYTNQETELNHALQFLESGIDKNESVILITDYAPREKRRGKTGVRAFGDMRTFFKLGLTDYLLEYEGHVGRKPVFPLMAICAYLKS